VLSRPSPAPTLAELQPMLLCERKTIPRESGWHFEIKYDGYRVLATTGAPRLKSRNGADATAWFPELITALSELPVGYIVDGEVCVLDDIGRSDFERLHTRARRKGWYKGANLVAYCLFDLLVGKGKDLRGHPIERRKAALRKLLDEPPAGLLYVDSVEDGAWLYGGSLYQGGERSPDWIKIKRPGAVPPKRFAR
jgi:bifunctional non-homologous end joining protein LigD